MSILKRNKMLILLAIMLFSVIGVFTVTRFNAAINTKALNPISEDIYLPSTAREYYSLSSPQATSIFGDRVAIIEKNSKILNYYDGESYSTYEGVGIFQTVKFLTKDLLFASINGSCCIFDLTKSLTPKYVFTGDLGDTPIDGNFDINGEYLITSSTGISIYKLTDLNEEETKYTLLQYRALPFTTDDKKPICINSNNQIFFVASGSIWLYNLETGNSSEIIKTSPDVMISNQNYLYYVKDNKIFRLDLSSLISTPTIVELTVKTDIYPNYDKYDLGKISTPSGLSFNNENLIVTDSSLNAVEEFSIQDKSLVFTGFAIAKGKTAYNRISQNSKVIDFNGTSIAVLDNNKITVIDNDGEKTFKNYLLTNYQNYSPNALALGEGKILTAKKGDKELQILTVNGSKSDGVLEKITTEENVVDIFYHSGIFYFMQHKVVFGEKGELSVYQLNLTDNSFVKLISENNVFTENSVMSVDVFGNIYVADTTADLIKKYIKESSYVIDSTFESVNVLDAINIETDLCGNLFVCFSDRIEHNGESYAIQGKLTYLTLDYSQKTAFYLKNEDERIYSTKSLPNVSFTELVVPASYKTTDEKALDVTNLKAYKLQNTPNVFSINIDKDKKLTYNGLYSGSATEFIKIDEMTVNNCTFYILTCGETVLVNKSQLTEFEIQIVDAPFDKGYVAVSVNGYYLPVITKAQEYTLTRNSETFHLTKESEIYPSKIFTVLGKDFYYSTVKDGEIAFDAYIPVDFIVKSLSKNYERETYTYALSNKTSVYLESSLTTKIADLEENTEIHVFDTEKEYSLIKYKVNDTWEFGYIGKDGIYVAPNTAIRNALIIISVAVAVFGTVIYFILKKKNV